MPGPATKRLREISRRAKAAPDEIAKAVGKVVTTEVRAQVRADGVSRVAGRRLGVKATILGSVAVVSASPKGAIGAWSIVNKGTRAHQIAARRKRTSRAMHLDGVWRTGPWHVSGSRAKGTWDQAIDNALPKIADAGRDELRRVVDGQ